MVAGLGSWCQDVSLGGCPGEFLIYPQKKSFFSKIMEFYIFISDQKDKTKVKQKSQNKLLVSIPEAGLVSKRGRGEMSKAMERRRGKICLDNSILFDLTSLETIEIS